MQNCKFYFTSGPMILIDWTVTDSWRVDYISPSVSRFGFKPEDFISGYMTYKALILEEDRADVIRKVEEFNMSNVSTFNHVHRIACAKGGVSWVETQFNVIRDKSGKVTNFQGYLLDITKQKKTVQMLEGVYHNVYDAIFIHDITGKILDVNDKMLKMYKVDREQVLALSIVNDLSSHDSPRDNLKDLWEKVIAGEDQLFTWKARRPSDGSVFDVEVFLARVVVATNNYIIANVRDISERLDSENALRKSCENLKEITNEVVNALTIASEKRDPYTAGHQQQVQRLACTIAIKMGLTEAQVEGLRIAASLHDIGKLYVPMDILNKPSTLSEFEIGIIRCHPEAGIEIIQNIPFEGPVAEIILQHHERLDGSGYPKELVEKDILLEAKILGVADVVIAMVSHRPYRPAFSLEDALEEIVHQKGTLFDITVVETCLKLKNSFLEIVS